jgi:hypothetical protein
MLRLGLRHCRSLAARGVLSLHRVSCVSMLTQTSEKKPMHLSPAPTHAAWAPARALSTASSASSEYLELSELTAIGAVDGRYGKSTRGLRGVFSEFGLIRKRVFVEVQWLLALSEDTGVAEVPALSTEQVGGVGRSACWRL